VNKPALLLLPSLLIACGGKGVSSEREAELAYIGLDGALSKAMGLGFDGYNAATDANIDPQTAAGDVSGTLTVTGQVDQGVSNNKEMRLDLSLVEYSDLVDLDEDDDHDFAVTYWTDTEDGLPALDLQLKDLPDGTLAGGLAGTFDMRGDLEGLVTLDLSFDGLLEDDGQGGTRRVEGETTVSGTATGPSGGVYAVDLQL